MSLLIYELRDEEHEEGSPTAGDSGATKQPERAHIISLLTWFTPKVLFLSLWQKLLRAYDSAGDRYKIGHFHMANIPVTSTKVDVINWLQQVESKFKFQSYSLVPLR